MNNNDEELEMFKSFRNELDTMSFPALKQMARNEEDSKQGTYTVIMDGEFNPVGFLLVIDGYVEGIYVKPEHRRKGYARNAVIGYILNRGLLNTFHVINKNRTAKKFWFSLFKCHVVESTEVDTLYQVDEYLF